MIVAPQFGKPVTNSKAARLILCPLAPQVDKRIEYLTINSNEQNNDKEHDEAPQFDELN